MDPITIAIIAYLVNGFGIWNIACQMESEAKCIASLCGYVFLWPIMMIFGLVISIAEAW
jgi:hypothetical protein